MIYTADTIESLHMQLRKTIKNRGHFPSDEVATKLLWLALRNITAGKVISTREWKGAMNQFAVLYEASGGSTSVKLVAKERCVPLPSK